MWARTWIAILFIGAASLTHSLHLNQIKALPKDKNSFDQLYLPDPAFLKITALGHQSLYADLLWLQTIQYYGDREKQGKPSPYLYRYFDAMTTLDPDFINLYTFASYVMGEDKNLRDKTIQLLQKGMRLNPDNWLIPYHMGLFYYLYYKDYENAAKYFEHTSKLPHAPDFAARMAAQLYRKADPLSNCQLSLQLWSENIQNASEKNLKERAQRHFIETATLCDLIRIEHAIKAFGTQIAAQPKPTPLPPLRRGFRRPQPTSVAPSRSIYPRSLEELVQVGLLKSLPLDFYKRPYLYDPQTGKVKVQDLPWPVYDIDLQPYLSKKS
ncbi:hypothetical protein COW36_13355 [bacterium (Candidatus Blackallbacteria) CG17_big_fil_post_rev_8_21_14_2_50_48_46]|uniref:Tetratricopeptide repeat protein n=1 Tax=bacterium (Candidatus Blackallbacteria) CG17_big_fil_post_rev_8_21_14_2_50_48_46 TaxID=2014261 RepID=A0A2M7G3F8_9BACT|nr:MAG: hypothetical protein COW64_21970 [bacterium (Candidatus Blackallbacteria) CG18_big_fil_WC_8_21_14_2_50_49_26]PIW16317.1 MAG: hypothetical protein COW36_13355 [bacterium (Candidatus Blackallbacteria) CG17_big_fil_post_rev_8_21_14_2_50_48_46]PIW45331.1 MAG: hypothetical protein COW20_20590 [bacterium (Candidatus Blackallbacteria) CG13_big_fil_rev_8_21_14_2_50_49_14]